MFGFYVGFEFGEVLTAVSALLTLAVFVFHRRRVGRGVLRVYFLSSLVLLPAYLNLGLFLRAGELLSPVGVFDMWFRHAVFYLGQLFFFLFVMRLFALQLEKANARTVPKAFARIMTVAYLALLLLPHRAHATHSVNLFDPGPTPYGVLLFLTDQGIQHLLAVLFFFVTAAVIRAQSLYAGLGPVKRVLNAFMLANACFILLHLWEYFTESLHLFPLTPETLGAAIEYAFQFGGILLMHRAAAGLGRARLVGVSAKS
jgi:hypothetical protein